MINGRTPKSNAEDAKKEAGRARMAGWTPERYIETGRVHAFEPDDDGDFYGLGYTLGLGQEDAQGSRHLDVEIIHR